MLQQEIQNTGAEGVSRAGGFDHAAQGQAGLKYPKPLIVGDASLGACGHIDQPEIGELGHQLGRSSVKIGLPGDKKQLVVGNLHDITLSESPVDLRSGLLQTAPQGRAQIWIKREDTVCCPGRGHRLLGCAAHRFSGKGQRAKVKDPGSGDYMLRHFVGGKERVGPGVPVEGEVPVAVFCRFDKGQCGVTVGVHH